MIQIKEIKGEDRKRMLVRQAIAFLKEHSGYVGQDSLLHYDEADCDGYCLADDLQTEFNIDEEEVGSV